MSQRLERLQKLAREVLSDEIRRLKDPRVGTVTVTDVRMTSDLAYAKVYISVIGDEDDEKRTLAGLKSASPHLRSALGKQMHTKHSPELQFLHDDLTERATRIEELLHKIHEEERDG
ncbi:MAG: 30S ribosome-binding factor RbfA [Actinomycetota bacterium]